MIMNDAGSALMGTGEGNGEQRATSAARKAVLVLCLNHQLMGQEEFFYQ